MYPIIKLYQKSMLLSLLLTSLMYLMGFSATAQNATVKGFAPVGLFLKDSVKIGEPVELAFSIKHPVNTQVIFPDSSYDFTPFEYIGRKYFPTNTIDSISTDSIVYTLATFEPEAQQELSLPVFLLTGKDSVAIYSKPAFIQVTPVVKVVPKAFNLEDNTDLLLISKKINYPYILIGGAVLIVLLYLLFILFGKTILRYYQLNTLGLRQRRFELVYGKLIKQWEQRKSTDTLQKILVSWKAHLEKLDDKPYSAFTSKEILAVLPEEPIKDKLQRIDAVIYGANDQSVVPTAHLRALLVVTRNLYNRRKEELKNA